jgi:UDP-glucuronate 4-epimerase
VPDTTADTGALERAVGYKPATQVEVGVGRFVAWYLERYGDEWLDQQVRATL